MLLFSFHKGRFIAYTPSGHDGEVFSRFCSRVQLGVTYKNGCAYGSLARATSAISSNERGHG